MSTSISPQPISEDAFAALVADRGLNLTADRFQDLRQAYAHVVAMREKLHSSRGYGAEPASVFRAKAV